MGGYCCSSDSTQDVSNNDLKELPDCIKELVELRELNLSRNGLQKLPVGMFELLLCLISSEFGKLRLTTLNLSDNKVTELPLSLRDMSSLQNLTLDNNPLLVPPAHVGTVTTTFFDPADLRSRTCAHLQVSCG
jgi:Leucine-rich repeat (LRR) protein